MKRYIALPLALLLALGFQGCFRDDSTEPTNAISELKAASELLAEYEIPVDEPLVLTAPEVTQTDPSKEIAYEWQVNYEVVSTEKEMSYLGDKYGKLPGRLLIKNGDTSIVQYFTVNVLYAYGSGVYVAASKAGKTVLSYIPTAADAEPKFDLLSANHPDTDFGTEPTALFVQTNTYDRNVIYLATKDPDKVFVFEANMMTLLHDTPSPREGVTIDYITDNGNQMEATMMEGNYMVSMAGADGIIKNGEFYNTFYSNGVGGLANRILYIPNEHTGYLNSQVYFDIVKGSFISMDKQSYSASIKYILSDVISGKFLVDMDLVQKNLEVAAVLGDPQTGTLTFAWISPGTYESRDSEFEPLPPAVKDIREIPGNAHLTANAQIEASASTNLLFYSDGSDLYAYSIVSKGNFPSEPVFSAGSGETIADLLFSKDESILYVATNAASGDMPGSVYAVDVLGGYKVLWSRKNFTGAIKQISERPR